MVEKINTPPGVLSKIVHTFLGGYYAFILILLAVILGLGAILVTPREEEPQIVVPLADVYVYYPGASAKEVEYLVATPLEKLLWQIDGVEYVYSMSKRDMAVVTVRFYVGEDREESLLKLYNKLYSNIENVTSGITGWVVKPVEIDDVPIITYTMYSKLYDDFALRRVAEELLARVESIENISRTKIFGGLPREVRVELDIDKTAGMGLSPLEVYQTLSIQNTSLTAGNFTKNNKNITVFSGPFLKSVQDVKKLTVGMFRGKPVYLEDIANVKDGPAERTNYVNIGFGPAFSKSHVKSKSTLSAVTIAIAKKREQMLFGLQIVLFKKLKFSRRQLYLMVLNLLSQETMEKQRIKK